METSEPKPAGASVNLPELKEDAVGGSKSTQEDSKENDGGSLPNEPKENKGFVWVYQEYPASESGLERAIITRNRILAAHSVYPQFQTGEESELPGFSELIQCQHPGEEDTSLRSDHHMTEAQGGHWVYPPPLAANYEAARRASLHRRTVLNFDLIRFGSPRGSVKQEQNPWGLVRDEDEDSFNTPSNSMEQVQISPGALQDYSYQAEDDVLRCLDPSTVSITEDIEGPSDATQPKPILVRISNVSSHDQVTSRSRSCLLTSSNANIGNATIVGDSEDFVCARTAGVKDVGAELSAGTQQVIRIVKEKGQYRQLSHDDEVSVATETKQSKGSDTRATAVSQNKVGVVEGSATSAPSEGSTIGVIMNAIIQQLKTNADGWDLLDNRQEKGFVGVSNVPHSQPQAEMATAEPRTPLHLGTNGDNLAQLIEQRTGTAVATDVSNQGTGTKSDKDDPYNVPQTKRALDSRAIDIPYSTSKHAGMETGSDALSSSLGRSKEEHKNMPSTGVDQCPEMQAMLRQQIESMDLQLQAAYDSLEHSEVEKRRLMKRLGRLRFLDLRLHELEALNRIAEALVPDPRDIEILDCIIERIKRNSF